MKRVIMSITCPVANNTKTLPPPYPIKLYMETTD